MRKSLLCLFLALGLLSTTISYAQDGAVVKKPLLEVFTASTCPPCVGGNLAIDGVLVNHPGEYTLVKYQMNWPGTGDPYYMEASMVRRNYYAVTGVPHLRTNGIRPHPELESWYPQLFVDSDFTELTGFTNISITAEASVDEALNLTSHVEIKAHAAYEAGLRVYIIAVEENTFDNAATNGETEFHNVVQGFLASSEGIELEALSADQVLTYDLSLDLSGSFTETGNDLNLIVFVQDHSTMDVKQSEMVEISHPFVDYSASFNIYDEDFNSIDGGKIAVAKAGEKVIVDSKAVASKLFPGTYTYEVLVPGLLPYNGEFTITDADILQDLIIEIPPFYFYEDFEASGIPKDWTVVNSQNDYFVQSAGQIVYQKTSGGDEVVYLILPNIAVNQGCVLSFKAGNSFGRSDLAVGIVTSTEDPAATYSELVSYEIFNLDYMHTFGARLDPSIVGDGYLCLKFSSTTGNYFYVDNVILIENEPGHKVQFLVTDFDGEVLPECEVFLTDEGLNTNTFGYATWRNCDPGEYNYSVEYKGTEVETGIVTVDGDVLLEIALNTSGIEVIEVDPFQIYPNPASDNLTIRGISHGEFQLMDIQGKLMKKQEINGQTKISVSDLPNGVYLVKIKTEEKTYTQRLSISK